MADPRAVLSVSGPDLPTDQITIGKGSFVVGRTPENQLALNNQKVSRRHVEFTWAVDTFMVTDLGSSNGTLLNDVRLTPNQPAAIKVGDGIGIGPYTLTVLSIDKGESRPDIPVPQIETREPEPIKVVAPEPPPVGAQEVPDEPQVFVSHPPPPANEAVTLRPMETLPPSPEPTAQPNPSGQEVDRPDAPLPVEMKAVEVSKKADVSLTTPPPRAHGSNGHRMPTLPYQPLEGVPTDESRYMQYLPGVYYESDFIKRYLLIMESMFAPYEWGIDSFEQFYNPNVTPPDWLRWIGEWFDIVIHPSVPIERQRAVVRELAQLYRARGTRRCITWLLELYFGVKPEIIELTDPPSSFKVMLPLPKKEDTAVNRALAEQLITAVKPAWTTFTLETD
jgi:phage tail-like protein